MTVVVWDGKTLAADKLIVAANAMRSRGTKIRAIGRYLIGYSGPLSVAEDFFQWARDRFPENEAPKSHTDHERGGIAMMISRDGNILIYDRSATPYRVEFDKYAIGAGAETAMTCLHLGHDAKTIVEACNATMIICGEGCDVLSFSNDE